MALISVSQLVRQNRTRSETLNMDNLSRIDNETLELPRISILVNECIFFIFELV